MSLSQSARWVAPSPETAPVNPLTPAKQHLRMTDMNSDEIEEMVREAINRSLAEEYRTIALAWLDRQTLIVRAARELGLLDGIEGGSE